MERVEFESKTEYGNTIRDISFFFTDYERDNFHAILKGYEKAKVEEFLDHIRAWVGMLHYVRQQPRLAHHVVDLKDMIKQLRKTHQHLLKILSDPHFKVLRPRHLMFLVQWIKNSKEGNLLNETRRNAKEALGIIERLIQNLISAVEMQKPNGRGGRPKADEIGFALLIAQMYGKFIGIPRPHSGAFRGVVKACFVAAEIPGDDRSHAIAQALEEYRKWKLAQSSSLQKHTRRYPKTTL